jgi:flagellar assembly protein FliH
MHLERQPLRVGRMPPVATPAASSPTAPDPQREALLRQAREDAERIGFEEGLRRGLAESQSQREPALRQAIAEATAALDDHRSRLAALQASLEAVLPDCVRAAQDEIVALCFETLCRMLGPHALRPDSVRAQVEALAAQGLAGLDASIHVHPKDAQHLLRSAVETASGFRWVADSDVTLGGCIVRRAGGGLDARLEAMLETCKDRLLAARMQQVDAETAR